MQFVVSLKAQLHMFIFYWFFPSVYTRIVAGYKCGFEWTSVPINLTNCHLIVTLRSQRLFVIFIAIHSHCLRRCWSRVFIVDIHKDPATSFNVNICYINFIINIYAGKTILYIHTHWHIVYYNSQTLCKYK